MGTDIDELKFVADLARSGGMMQAQNEHLRSDLQEQKLEAEGLRAENQKLRTENLKLRNENERLGSENQELRNEVARLREWQQQSSQQPQVVVNNFYLLSVPKTFKYVSALDNDGRQFVGHFMHQTLSDNTPQSIIAQVDEMTQLEGSQEKRLAEAMEELAQKPTTQNNYGDTVETKTVFPHVENYQPQIQTQNNEMPMPPVGKDNHKLPAK